MDFEASTGPRLLGRGDRFVDRRHAVPCFASTGPRLLGRGDFLAEVVLRGHVRASTGPRLLGRGDASMWARVGTDTLGFNGAAPFGARRLDFRCGVVPRLAELQRGRAFWGAEMIHQCVPLRKMTCASTGPRLLGRGDAFEIHGGCTYRNASTGPRLLGRGDPRCAAPVRSGGVASTGPRLLGRGDFSRFAGTTRNCLRFNGAAPFGARRSVLSLADALVTLALQRGRAFWGAEMIGGRIGGLFRIRLQRGRAFWGAEI